MTTIRTSLSIPAQGKSPSAILDEIRNMKQGDVDWRKGRAWSLVYHAGEEHENLLKAASEELYSSNYLNPVAFKSLHRMEQDVVRMTATMLHGDDQTVGVITSGGTESILLAMLAYRERARKHNPSIQQPEVVAPSTIHPAFDKAAHYFGLKIIKVPVAVNGSGQEQAMEEQINENTILLVASAPSYPQGNMDPIEALSGIALRHQLPFHVDGCIGGFMLPWVEKLGYPVPLWDFRLKGVTSISADLHKFGFGAKGSSVITYRNMDYLKHQFTVTTDFPGGIYLSPTLLGTRPGGPIAAAWASLMHLGEAGYLAIAKELMQGTEKLKAGLEAMEGMEIIGKPVMNILSFSTIRNRPDIFVIADKLEEKGWMADRQQFPECMHLTILPTNVGVIDEYLRDLQEALSFARKHPGAAAKGNAAVYGMMARVSFRGMVEKSARKIMEDLFGNSAISNGVNSDNEGMLLKSPAWMGILNRFLRVWQRWTKRLTHKT